MMKSFKLTLMVANVLLAVNQAQAHMKRLLITLVTLAATCATLSVAHAGLLGFDSLHSRTPISNGYGGLNWNNFYAIDGSTYKQSGYFNGIVSPNNVAVNGYGAPASFSSNSAFTLNNGFFTAAWNDGLQVTAIGSLNGNQMDTTTFTVNTSGPTREVFNWSNINNVLFSSVGGTPNPAFTGGRGTHFALDNLTLNGASAVPEPGTVWLLGSGLLILILVLVLARKRIRADSGCNGIGSVGF